MKKISRRQALRRRRISKLIFLGLIILLLYFIFIKSNLFIIKKIEVSGHKHTDKEEIIKKSTFKEGYKTYIFNKKDGIKNIKTLPYIKEVEIKRKLPNKVKISVSERKAIAITSYMDKIMLVDRSGRVLDIKNRAEKVNLTEIFGLTLNNIKLGDQLFQGKLSDEYIEFIDTADKKKILSRIKYLNFSDMDDIVVELRDGEKVYFGNVNNLEYKLDFLDNILKDTKSKNIKVKKIEFNKGENPIVVVDDRLEKIEDEDENH